MNNREKRIMDNQNIIDSALYSIDRIRPEIEKGNFRVIYRQTHHLLQLVRFAAIVEERQDVGIPIIKPPE